MGWFHRSMRVCTPNCTGRVCYRLEQLAPRQKDLVDEVNVGDPGRDQGIQLGQYRGQVGDGDICHENSPLHRKCNDRDSRGTPPFRRQDRSEPCRIDGGDADVRRWFWLASRAPVNSPYRRLEGHPVRRYRHCPSNKGRPSRPTRPEANRQAVRWFPRIHRVRPHQHPACAKQRGELWNRAVRLRP